MRGRGEECRWEQTWCRQQWRVGDEGSAGQAIFGGITFSEAGLAVINETQLRAGATGEIEQQRRLAAARAVSLEAIALHCSRCHGVNAARCSFELQRAPSARHDCGVWCTGQDNGGIRSTTLHTSQRQSWMHTANSDPTTPPIGPASLYYPYACHAPTPLHRPTLLPHTPSTLLLSLENHLLHLHLIKHIIPLHRVTQRHDLVGHEPKTPLVASSPNRQ